MQLAGGNLLWLANVRPLGHGICILSSLVAYCSHVMLNYLVNKQSHGVHYAAVCCRWPFKPSLRGSPTFLMSTTVHEPVFDNSSGERKNRDTKNPSIAALRNWSWCQNFHLLYWMLLDMLCQSSAVIQYIRYYMYMIGELSNDIVMYDVSQCVCHKLAVCAVATLLVAQLSFLARLKDQFLYFD